MLYPDQKPGKSVGRDEELRRLGVRRGWPDWRIEVWIAADRLKRKAEREAKRKSKRRR